MTARAAIADPEVRTFEGRPLPDPAEPAWDQGLAFDLQTLIDRRRVLMGMGLAGLSLGLVACGTGSGGATASPSAAESASAGTAECVTEIPEETAGPFPGDGSNGPDVLSDSGVVRKDIRSSFGSSTTVATGIPLTIRFAVLDLAKACEPYAGAAIYAWHCDQAGRYSMYSQGVEGENYLRGVQAAGDDGIVEFTSVFPACYSGRWPHIHFEVYPSLEAATDSANQIATSQIALPKDISDEVYATSGYEQSVSNMNGVSLERDNVFGDDAGVHQLATMSGNVSSGYTAALTIGV
jgi:protocatechuate 3,4-dioxygenase beta subunit